MPQNQMNGIVYHEDYNKYDLGIEHPLVGDKPKKTMEILKEKNILSKIDTFKPKIATEKDILRVHTKEYIQQLKKLSKTGGMLSLDTPAPLGIYKIASLATGGSILAGEKLFEKKYNIMSNPLGGFHHAGKSSSSGFCFLNDIAITIEYLREKYQIKKFLIFDQDVHHGNGTQEIYFEDPSVLNISFHQDGRTLYPGTGDLKTIGKNKGEGYTINLPMPPGTGSKAMLYAFDELIPKLTNEFKPEVILYQSGVDSHHSDPLADLFISHQTYYTLAKKMRKLSEETCDKLIVLFGGGYNSIDCINSYYNIMCGLLNLKGYISENDENQFQKFEQIKKLVSKLKKLANPYWGF